MSGNQLATLRAREVASCLIAAAAEATNVRASTTYVVGGCDGFSLSFRSLPRPFFVRPSTLNTYFFSCTCMCNRTIGRFTHTSHIHQPSPRAATNTPAGKSFSFWKLPFTVADGNHIGMGTMLEIMDQRSFSFSATCALGHQSAPEDDAAGMASGLLRGSSPNSGCISRPGIIPGGIPVSLRLISVAPARPSRVPRSAWIFLVMTR